jgi:hypothetical protein
MPLRAVGDCRHFRCGWGHLWRVRQDLQGATQRGRDPNDTYREAGLTLVARDAPGSAGRLCAELRCNTDVTTAAKRMFMVTERAGICAR